MQPSLSLSLVALVFFCLSDPAKSTKLIFENLSVVFPSIISNCLNDKVMIVWALEDVLFISVDPIDLFLLPKSIIFSIASNESTACLDKSWT